MGLQTRVWYFKTDLQDNETAAAVLDALKEEAEPPIALQKLPVKRVMSALTRAFPQAKVEGNSIEADLVEQECFFSVTVERDHVEAFFEGDDEGDDDRPGPYRVVTDLLFDLGFGCFDGQTWYPPGESPFATAWFYDVGYIATERLIDEILAPVQREQPESIALHYRLSQQAMRSEEFHQRVAELGAAIEADYRAAQPADVVAKTHFVRYLPCGGRRKVEWWLDGKLIREKIDEWGT